jgi:hypothetical protein
MKNRLLILCLFLFFQAAPQSQSADLRRLESGGYANLVEAKRGKPFAVALWSVSCAPCLAEMTSWKKALGQRKDIDLVLIALDGPEEERHVKRLLDRYAPPQAENWNFGQTPARRLSFEIDPLWHGEMPRSYFYQADGKITAISGPPSEAFLKNWVLRNAGK